MIGFDYGETPWKAGRTSTSGFQLMVSLRCAWWWRSRRWTLQRRQTRADEDVDVVILRDDQKQLDQAFVVVHHATPDHRLASTNPPSAEVVTARGVGVLIDAAGVRSRTSTRTSSGH